MRALLIAAYLTRISYDWSHLTVQRKNVRAEFVLPPMTSTLFLAMRNEILGTAKQFLRSSAMRDAGALGIGALLSQAVFFLAAPVFLRLYHPSDFGLYSFYYSLLSLLATLGTWKIERLIVVVHRRSAAIRLLAALISIAAAAGVFLLVFIALAQTAAVQSLPEMAKIFPLAWIAPAWLFILVVATGLRFYCIRVGKFRAVAAAQIVRAILFAAGTIATAIVWKTRDKNGALVMLSWMLIADTCALIVQIRANGRTVQLVASRPRFRKSLAVLVKYGKTVGTLAVSQILGSINQQIPISTVALAFGATPAGWYSLANVLLVAPVSVIASSVTDVVNQRFSRLFASRKPFSSLALKITAGMAAALFLPFMAIAILAPRALPVILGSQWLGAAPSIMYLVVAVFLSFVAAPISCIALIVDARRYILIWHAIRTAGLAGLGAAAILGLISYMTWLAMLVALQSLLYISDIVVECFFVRMAESAWRKQAA
jgi:O-antigen/teichoic acid export membrane protein